MDVELVKSVAGLGGIPVVLGLVQIVKSWLEDARLWPVAALILGIAWSVGISRVLEGRPEIAVVEGIVVGLAASGLWSAGKTGAGR